MTKQKLIDLISSVDVPDDADVTLEAFDPFNIVVGFEYNSGYDGAFKDMKTLEISFDS